MDIELDCFVRAQLGRFKRNDLWSLFNVVLESSNSVLMGKSLNSPRGSRWVAILTRLWRMFFWIF